MGVGVGVHECELVFMHKHIGFLSGVCSVCSHSVPCGCISLLPLVVQVCSVARLRLAFHPLQPFYLYITPRKEGTEKHFSRNSKFILTVRFHR